jgi:hypothetical protein
MTPLPLGCSKQRCPVAGGKCHGFGLHLQCSRQTRDGRAPASAGARVESRWDLSTCWARPGGAARSKQFLIDAIEDLRWILNDFTVDYYRCYRWFIGCLGSWRTFCFEMGCEGVVKFFFLCWKDLILGIACDPSHQSRFRANMVHTRLQLHQCHGTWQQGHYYKNRAENHRFSKPFFPKKQY